MVNKMGIDEVILEAIDVETMKLIEKGQVTETYGILYYNVCMNLFGKELSLGSAFGEALMTACVESYEMNENGELILKN